jgi:CheY-like chemotaxis protein/tetratricopeptide (TPR) repeat protein
MGKKILLVDDDPIARKAMDRLIGSESRLSSLEPRVVQAASGQQGLAVFVSERPDLIITDLFMPAMDGFAFCRALREAPFGKAVPIIVISGIYKDPALAASLSEEVRAYFLPKPLRADDLVELILTCLEQTPPPQESPLELRPPGQDLGGDIAPTPPSPHQARPTPPYDLAVDLSGLDAAPKRALREEKVPLSAEPPTAVPGTTASQRISSGSLAEVHVPRLIFDLAETSATGTLSLARGKVRKDLYIRNGQVVAAESNLRQEALGTLLCAKGIIDENQLTYLLSETKSRGHKMGAVLVELGWLTPEEVLDCLAAQARKRIVDCLRWDVGTYTFTVGDTFGECIIEHDLHVAETVLLGLYRSATPETLVQRFDQSGACPIQLTYRFDRYKDTFESIFGGDISQVVADAPTIGVLAMREDAHVVMAEVDALIETGLAALGAAVDESYDSASSFESSFSLEKLGAELGRRFDAIVQKPVDLSFSEVSKADISALPAVPSVAHIPDDASSGALDIGYRATPEKNGDVQTDGSGGENAASTPTENLRQSLLREYLMIYGKSHYDILGVAPGTATPEIEMAIHRKMQQFSAEDAAIELASVDKMRLEAVRTAIAQAGRVLCDPTLRKNYDRSQVATQTEPVDPLGAELAFGEGLQLFQTDRFEEALIKFESAVTARPDQALYHAYLGWTEFVAYGPERANNARDRLDHALALDPDLAEAHAMLGRLAATEDDAVSARRYLERSLAIDPEQADTVDLLLEAYARLPEPDAPAAERYLRKLVSALGERAEPLRKRLWLELGNLYENHLSDRSSARIAYDTASRLAPKNMDSLRKSLELNAEDPARWRETAHALTSEWQLHPHEASPALRLLGLFQQQGMHDAAGVTAAAMVLRGVADDSIRRFAEEQSPRMLQPMRVPLPRDLFLRAGYRPEESDLEDLAAALVETGVLKPFARDELGLLESDVPMPTRAQPGAFREVLHYVCSLFAVDVPKDVISLAVLGGDARMADMRPPALLCGRSLLETDDTVELGFRLSRAMALCAPGRLAGSSRSGGQMRPYFVAALSLTHAAGATVAGAPALEALQAIGALHGTARTRIIEAARKVSRRSDSLNLSVWSRSLARVATRLALLIAMDLLRVGRAVAEEEGPAALDDLLAFALSLDHLDLRQSMGRSRA